MTGSPKKRKITAGKGRSGANVRKEQIQSALASLQNSYMWQLLSGMETDAANRWKQFAELAIPLDAASPFILLGVRGGADDREFASGAVAKILKVLTGYLTTISIYVLLSSDSYRPVWVIQPAEFSGANLGPRRKEVIFANFIAELHKMLSAISADCQKRLGITTIFLLSEKMSWGETRLHYDIFLQNLRRNNASAEPDRLMSNELLITGTYGMAPESTRDYHLEDQIRALLNQVGLLELYLDNGQKNEFTVFFTDLAQKAQKVEITRPELTAEVYYAVANLFLAYLNRLDLAKIVPQNDLNRLIRMEPFTGGREFTGFFLDLAHTLFNIPTGKTPIDLKKVTVDLQKYIQSHLEGDLSLNHLSEVAHFNPSYLSRFYKQVTGRSLSGYIAETRLGCAKELLRSTDLEVREVARKVGYNTAYFCRFFRRNLHMTPQEYREISRPLTGKLTLVSWEEIR